MRQISAYLALLAIAAAALVVGIYVIGDAAVHAPVMAESAPSPPSSETGPETWPETGPETRGVPTFLPAEQRAAAPAISMVGSDGESFGLERFIGKVVVLNFWATWCAPCVEELPSLARLQEKLGGEGFEVVALSLDRGGIAEVVPFLAEHGITTLTPYVDASMTAMRLFRLSGLPTTVLIDAKGREIGRVVGPAQWDDAMHVALVSGFIAERDQSSAEPSPQP